MRQVQEFGSSWLYAVRRRGWVGGGLVASVGVGVQNLFQAEDSAVQLFTLGLTLKLNP